MTLETLPVQFLTVAKSAAREDTTLALPVVLEHDSGLIGGAGAGD